jgi:UDP-N-acetylmuramate dehydrogenase
MESLRFLESLTKGTILFNEPMAKHTSYGIGGPVDAYIVPKDSEELANILKYSNDNRFPVYFIGSGSNLLVSVL